jgi:hypothetical protein
MRSQEQIQKILSTVGKSTYHENFISQNDINIILNEFYSNEQKVKKNTGPLTLDIIKVVYNKEPNAYRTLINIYDNIVHEPITNELRFYWVFDFDHYANIPQEVLNRWKNLMECKL